MRFFQEDKVTGLQIKDSFYEEWKDLINRILFWTILFAPYMFVINDIYQNKLIHDNKFWIKRAKLYFAFLVIIYFIMSLTLHAHIDYMIALNLFLTYLMLFGILKAQEHYGHLLQGNCAEYKPSKEEIEKIILVQRIDEKEETTKKRIQFSLIFIGMISFYFITIYKLDSNSIIKIIMLLGSILLPILYDILIQKYLKRDITELFWKKRIAYYLALVSPIYIIIIIAIVN